MNAEVYSYDNKIRPINYIGLGVMSNEEIKEISALGKDTIGVDIADTTDTLAPKKGGLNDTRFGTTDPKINCNTCGLSSKYCVGHPGHIDLAEPVFHIGFIHFVKKILSCVCLKCSKLLVYKNERDLLDMVNTKSGKNRLNEIKNIAKNITHCQKINYGCGTPVSKIKLDIKKKTCTVLITAEVNISASGESEAHLQEGKKKLKQILTPNDCYNILKNISDTDCMVMGIDPTKTRPENMIHKVFPVPPVAVRPSVKADFTSTVTSEDDLTHKLADIIKDNLRIRRYKESLNETNNKYGADYAQLLQYHVATYFNNETLSLPKAEQRNKVIKCLSSRLKGKEGRIRGNLMGKRVDFSARTVITSDPSLEIDELGVPKKIAQN